MIQHGRRRAADSLARVTSAVRVAIALGSNLGDRQAHMKDAIAGLHRISPATRFLGSYGRADAQTPVVPPHTSDEAFRAAHAWVGEILAGETLGSGLTVKASPTA